MADAELLTVDPRSPDPRAIARGAELIRAGRLVAFPTETVYGLGANALDAAAVQRIFDAKGRPDFNPIIVHVADAREARNVVSAWPALAGRLADEFWPGPLTLVLPRCAAIPPAVSAGRESVAVRVPAHPVALALLRAAGRPIAAPSANRFTRVSPTTAAHVQRALGDRIDLILDGGATEVGIESTVVDLSGDRPVLLRPGTIEPAELEAITGPLAKPAAASRADEARAAPGMLDRHYAPRARVVLAASEDSDAIDRAVSGGVARGERVGVMLRSARPVVFAAADGDVPVVRMPADPAGYARDLYATLHALDASGCDLIVIERPPRGGAWTGVLDRLERAAHRSE